MSRAGLTREGRGVVPVWIGDPVRVAVVPVTAGCGGLWKGESVGWRYDVSIFLRWRAVQISSVTLLPQLSVPGRQLLGDGKVLDCCVARQRGNGKWREKGNEG